MHSHLIRSKLESLVAEHLDHLHYISDIVLLGTECLNEIIVEHLLERLLIPLYVYSLFDIPVSAREEEETPHISSSTALFLLSQVCVCGLGLPSYETFLFVQVFLILSHPVLVTQLAFLILTGDHSLLLPPSIINGSQQVTMPPRSPSTLCQHRRNSSRSSMRGFVAPEETLDSSFQRTRFSPLLVSDECQVVYI